MHSVKLPAGSLVLYPSTSLHHVRPVTRGARVCSFFWLQSMVRDDGERTLLFDLDSAIRQLNQVSATAHPVAVQLTGVYHNLLRNGRRCRPRTTLLAGCNTLIAGDDRRCSRTSRHARSANASGRAALSREIPLRSTGGGLPRVAVATAAARRHPAAAVAAIREALPAHLDAGRLAAARRVREAARAACRRRSVTAIASCWAWRTQVRRSIARSTICSRPAFPPPSCCRCFRSIRRRRRRRSTTRCSRPRPTAPGGARVLVPSLSCVPPYFDHPGYIAALCARIRAAIAVKAPDHVVLTFHGLPERYVTSGDPYREHCDRTVAALTPRHGLGAGGLHGGVPVAIWTGEMDWAEHGRNPRRAARAEGASAAGRRARFHDRLPRNPRRARQ